MFCPGHIDASFSMGVFHAHFQEMVLDQEDQNKDYCRRRNGRHFLSATPQGAAA
jgi:hypothetical protein